MRTSTGRNRQWGRGLLYCSDRDHLPAFATANVWPHWRNIESPMLLSRDWKHERNYCLSKIYLHLCLIRSVQHVDFSFDSKKQVGGSSAGLAARPGKTKRIERSPSQGGRVPDCSAIALVRHGKETFAGWASQQRTTKPPGGKNRSRGSLWGIRGSLKESRSALTRGECQLAFGFFTTLLTR